MNPEVLWIYFHMGIHAVSGYTVELCLKQFFVTDKIGLDFKWKA
jgi:hypothetical protein